MFLKQPKIVFDLPQYFLNILQYGKTQTVFGFFLFGKKEISQLIENGILNCDLYFHTSHTSSPQKRIIQIMLLERNVDVYNKYKQIQNNILQINVILE